MQPNQSGRNCAFRPFKAGTKFFTITPSIKHFAKQRIILRCPRFSCIFRLRFLRLFRRLHLLFHRAKNRVQRTNNFCLIAAIVIRENLSRDRIHPIRQDF